MNCENAIELLPWLLNGTLDAQEAAEVRRHLETCKACREALRDTRQAWTTFDQHLPAESLVSLAYGEPPSGLNPAAAERHLASCPQCAAELELARMSRRLEEDDRIAVFPARTARESGRESRTWQAAALAAGLAAVVATGGWIHTASGLGQVANLEAYNRQIQEEQAQLQGEVKLTKEQLARLAAATSREPQLNTWTGDVDLRDVVRSRQQVEEEIAIPGSRMATPILGPSREIPSPEREVQIVDEAGTVVFRKGGLRLNADTGDFTITFLPGFLKPGHYTIRLHTPDGRPAETYKIRVE